MRQPRGMLALYGNVALLRLRCSECKGMAFVIDNRSGCCGAQPIGIARHYKQISEPRERRRIPSKSLQRQLLEVQANSCLYCDRKFGSEYRVGTRDFTVKVTWDHMVPFSYRFNNGDLNYAAACARCNSWKGSRLFATVQEARDYLAGKWTAYLTRGLAPRHVRRLSTLIDAAGVPN